MTPKELAEAANNIADNVVLPEVIKFLREDSASNIQLFIHHLNVLGKPHNYELAKIALHVRIADDQSKSAEKMERQTDKIVRLTWGLFWLTLGLAFVAAVQLYIMLK
jgi:hypothetical protein